jgi:4-diphosphocytidyl-2-C-methyl-D-erythritol kinase
MKPAELHSYPKINLFLRVVNKRNDGYHNIESLFLPLDSPRDTISVSESENGISIVSDSKLIPLNRQNICFKAAEKFAQLAGVPPSWKIKIKKNIPVAAGLGGGSSNAATLIRILCSKYALNPTSPEIRSLAASIGADVPFFLNPDPAKVTGIGEKIVRCSFPPVNVVLLNPKFPVSARWAYNNVQTSENRQTLNDFLEHISRTPIPEQLRNDLAPAVFRKFPVMKILESALKKYGAAAVGMSGSGPTMFGICSSRHKAEAVTEQIKQKYGTAVWCRQASTLPLSR